jgi:hypothetical protein
MVFMHGEILLRIVSADGYFDTEKITGRCQGLACIGKGVSSTARVS